ncbi:hypothetical protein AURDEDRAFT_167692 [Auricularia subglabra TFB-10046 SS5]|nr:hypothetical protein AURDEDRAFT_167692 [Auricularia subglabra TFB-10046 SS5]
MTHFEIDYPHAHDHDDPVLKSLIPLLKLAVPLAKSLKITIESMYRLHLEETLSIEAPFLKVFYLYYAAGPHPELPLTMPLGKGNRLFDSTTGMLRTLHLYSIILPSKMIPAFENVDEVFFIHGSATVQNEFPCYLFDYFPKMTRLRLTGGFCWFKNAPNRKVGPR